jgi:hypothetical protein
VIGARHARLPDDDGELVAVLARLVAEAAHGVTAARRAAIVGYVAVTLHGEANVRGVAALHAA